MSGRNRGDASKPQGRGKGGTGPSDPDEIISTGSVFLTPGGKVDAEAMRRALDAQEQQAGGEGEGGAGEDDAELRRVVFRLQHDLNKRLDKYLTDRITFMSRTQLQRLIDEGGVLVNGRPPKASTTLRLGDVIEVVVPPPPSTEIQPEDIPLDVLFEDEHLIVINKAPGIITHPARSHLRGTLINALAYHFRHRSPTGGALSTVGGQFARPGVVHRLDRDTSGVMVFAKRDEAHWKLGHQFEHRRVDKRYLAVVHGRPEPEADLIELPLGPHPSREKGYREKYVVRHDELGKHAVTIYRVREGYWGDGSGEPGSGEVAKWRSGKEPGPLPTCPGWSAPRHSATRPLGHSATSSPDFSLVELELRTGRTHQIRVHLSHLGFPIVGDDMYGGKPFADAAGNVVIDRQALHAALLGFRHPITDEPLVFTAPLRGDMAALVRTLRARAPVRRPEIAGATVDLARAMM